MCHSVVPPCSAMYEHCHPNTYLCSPRVAKRLDFSAALHLPFRGLLPLVDYAERYVRAGISAIIDHSLSVEQAADEVDVAKR